MSGDAGALSESAVGGPMTTDHTAYQVYSSVKGRARIGRSPGEGLNTGCHKTAPVRCPCSK